MVSHQCKQLGRLDPEFIEVMLDEDILFLCDWFGNEDRRDVRDGALESQSQLASHRFGAHSDGRSLDSTTPWSFPPSFSFSSDSLLMIPRLFRSCSYVLATIFFTFFFTSGTLGETTQNPFFRRADFHSSFECTSSPKAYTLPYHLGHRDLPPNTVSLVIPLRPWRCPRFYDPTPH